MRKLFFPALALFLLTAFASAKLTPEEYNDAIINEQNKILRIMNNMSSHFSTDLDKAEQLRGDLQQQCKKSVTALQTMPAYDGDTQFRDAGVALFSFYAEVSTHENKEMIDILKKTDMLTSDIDRMRELQEELFGRELTLVYTFREAQKEFAKKYGL